MSVKKLGCDYCIITVEPDGSSSHQDSCLGLEIARLRAEVERLQFIEADWIGLKSLLKHRDETLARWPRAERVVELENALARANAVVRAAEAGKPLAERLANLLISEDIQDDDLREASETLLPQMHDFFLKLTAALAAYRERA